MLAPHIAANRRVWATLETGRIPGVISAVIPAAAAASRKRKKQSAEKKNWLIARSAPASILRLRLSKSAAGLAASGWHSGWQPTEISNGATFFSPSTRAAALA